MAALAVSPHFDDAVWSAGAHLYALPDVTVATVFAKPPPDGLLTSFDAQCGFHDTSLAAHEIRRDEDIRACHVINAARIDGPFPDSQYGGDPTTEDQIVAWLSALLADGTYNHVIAPLGLMHPDHRVTATASRLAARAIRCRLTVYEEIPARVWDPREAVTCIQEIEASGIRANTAALDVTERAYNVKAAASACYASQVDDPIRAVLAVPERLWDLS